MIVGTDTYVTREEADEYVRTHYRHEAPPRNTWENMNPQGGRDVLLTAACLELETLAWQGRAVSAEQTLAFPRSSHAGDVPQSIKYAQIELALWMADDKSQAARKKRAELRLGGVTSYSIGDLSESYGDGAAVLPAPLSSPRCAALIRRYLSGGYAVY